MSKAFWETVYKTQFGSYKIQIIPPITNLDYRRMSIEASKSLFISLLRLIIN
jgi:hypothetical protein